MSTRSPELYLDTAAAIAEVNLTNSPRYIILAGMKVHLETVGHASPEPINEAAIHEPAQPSLDQVEVISPDSVPVEEDFMIEIKPSVPSTTKINVNTSPKHTQPTIILKAPPTELVSVEDSVIENMIDAAPIEIIQPEESEKTAVPFVLDIEYVKPEANEAVKPEEKLVKFSYDRAVEDENPQLSEKPLDDDDQTPFWAILDEHDSAELPSQEINLSDKKSMLRFIRRTVNNAKQLPLKTALAINTSLTKQYDWLKSTSNKNRLIVGATFIGSMAVAIAIGEVGFSHSLVNHLNEVTKPKAQNHNISSSLNPWSPGFVKANHGSSFSGAEVNGKAIKVSTKQHLGRTATRHQSIFTGNS